MKRIRMWLRELSLTQQLLLIVFSFVIVFAGFVFMFLSPSIDKFSETEMYNILHNSQTTLISFIEDNPGELPSFKTNPDVENYIYLPTSERFISLGTIEAPPALKEIISGISEDLTSGTLDEKLEAVDETGSGVEYLYCITRMKTGNYLVSVMKNAYRVQFQQSLINSVVLLNILFFSAFFILILMWVGTLIIPLAQIKNYVTKVKNDDPSAALAINRYDEIGEVASAITDMADELDRQNREKEEMIQNISHDLKTPIATIKSYSEAIKDGIYPYETLEKSVDVIIEHANRLEKKVHSLIILNKMGYLLDDCEEGDTLNMSRIIDKAILSLKVIRPEIEFIRDVDETVCFHGEEEPWRIVVENLLDNALRYAKSYIKVSLNRGELRVINDGSKIDDDIIDKLFRPYEKGTDGKFGLGLSIVYRVATTYGYRAEAENLPEGVCFRIWNDSSMKDRKPSRSREKKKKEKNRQETKKHD